MSINHANLSIISFAKKINQYVIDKTSSLCWQVKEKVTAHQAGHP